MTGPIKPTPEQVAKDLASPFGQSLAANEWADPQPTEFVHTEPTTPADDLETADEYVARVEDRHPTFDSYSGVWVLVRASGARILGTIVGADTFTYRDGTTDVGYTFEAFGPNATVYEADAYRLVRPEFSDLMDAEADASSAREKASDRLCEAREAMDAAEAHLRMLRRLIDTHDEGEGSPGVDIRPDVEALIDED